MVKNKLLKLLFRPFFLCVVLFRERGIKRFERNKSWPLIYFAPWWVKKKEQRRSSSLLSSMQFPHRGNKVQVKLEKIVFSSGKKVSPSAHSSSVFFYWGKSGDVDNWIFIEANFRRILIENSHSCHFSSSRLLISWLNWLAIEKLICFKRLGFCCLMFASLGFKGFFVSLFMSSSSDDKSSKGER